MNQQELSIGSVATHESKRNYPFNCWWVGATTEEVTRKPISRWLLEQRVVLFRTEDGAVAALEDRCAHRWAPLSLGKLIGDEIACLYHGFRYNTQGRCTLVPSQARPPAALKVKSYPVRESGSLVWLWMGDPERADPALLPVVPWFTDPAFVRIDGYIEVGCNYMAVQENILDMTHIAFLHAASAQADPNQAEGWQEPPVDVQGTERTVTIILSHRDVPVGPVPATTMGIEPTKRINRRIEETFASPGCHFGGMDMEDPSPQEGGRAHYSFRTLHCVTPISPNRCHYWWANAQDYAHQLPKRDLKAMSEAVLMEDKYLLEAIQATREQDLRGDNVPEFSVAADRAPMLARGILKRMLDAEAG